MRITERTKKNKINNHKKPPERLILRVVMKDRSAATTPTAGITTTGKAVITVMADIATTDRVDITDKAATIVTVDIATTDKVAAITDKVVTTVTEDITVKADITEIIRVAAITDRAALTEIIREEVSADQMVAETLTNVLPKRLCLFQENRLQ